jgi:hypothetical protein
VEVVGKGYGNNVDIRPLQERPVVRDELGDVEFLGGLPPALWRNLGKRDNPGRGVEPEARQVVLADSAGSCD